MSRQFIAPAIRTQNDLGAVELVASFEISLELEPREIERTARGERIHQAVLGGTVKGPRLSGTVYPQGGGEFGIVRSDGVEELFTRLLLVADNEEWLYTQLSGYVARDGYARFQAVFDADRQGPHAWLNESMFIGSIDIADDGRSRTMTYYEAV
jgi:hypothetical protein